MAFDEVKQRTIKNALPLGILCILGPIQLDIHRGLESSSGFHETLNGRQHTERRDRERFSGICLFAHLVRIQYHRCKLILGFQP